MARQLRGSKPKEVKRGKPKVIIFGPGGVGKTWWALTFPSVYYIDTEGGAEEPQYQERLKEALYFGRAHGSQDFEAVTEEVKTLATTSHNFRTLVIDSFSELYSIEAAIQEAKVGSDFGKNLAEANKPTRKLLQWLDKLDMTVILCCHQKDVYDLVDGKRECVGQTFDGYKKLEYKLNLIFKVEKRGDKRVGIVQKSRIEGFPDKAVFDLTFKEFARRYGQDLIEKEAEAVDLATTEQIGEMHKLIGEVGLEQKTIDKWLKAANADSFNDMDTKQIAGCIDLLRAKTKGAA